MRIELLKSRVGRLGGSVVSWLFNGLMIGLLVAWMIGQVLRDQSWWTGLLFYIPTPLVCFLSAALVFMRLSRRLQGSGRSAEPRLGRQSLAVQLRTWVAGVVLLLSTFVITSLENQWMQATRELPPQDLQDSAPGASIRLIHWNLMFPMSRWHDQKPVILGLAPEIIALSETTDSVRSEDLPGYSVLRLGPLLLAAKGQLERLDNPNGKIVPGGVVEGMIVRCHLESGQSIDILLADHTSNIRIARDHWLRSLMKVAVEAEVDLLVGDLNAPRRSNALNPLPEPFQHAYDEAGAGWSYTWPVPVPMFAIDQCIAGKRVDCLSYRLESHETSDHRLQVLDFSIQTSPR